MRIRTFVPEVLVYVSDAGVPLRVTTGPMPAEPDGPDGSWQLYKRVKPFREAQAERPSLPLDLDRWEVARGEVVDGHFPGGSGWHVMELAGQVLFVRKRSE